MYTIHLKNIRLHGFHGLYPQEKLTGNDFEINISCRLADEMAYISHIEETINYETVFNILQKRFAQRCDLLETLAADVAEAVKAQYPLLKSISISIDKCNAPIAGMQGRVGVTFEKNFLAV
jgi:7,8-dihydroneopterin aldolase/epimerase/oxygenase